MIIIEFPVGAGALTIAAIHPTHTKYYTSISLLYVETFKLYSSSEIWSTWLLQLLQEQNILESMFLSRSTQPRQTWLSPDSSFATRLRREMNSISVRPSISSFSETTSLYDPITTGVAFLVLMVPSRSYERYSTPEPSLNMHGFFSLLHQSKKRLCSLLAPWQLRINYFPAGLLGHVWFGICGPRFIKYIVFIVTGLKTSHQPSRLSHQDVIQTYLFWVIVAIMERL